MTGPHYVSYIKPHLLHQASDGHGDDPELPERTFICAHQMQEVCLSQINVCIASAISYLQKDNILPERFYELDRDLERATTAGKVLVDTFKLLGDLDRVEFAKFRPKLGDASGRQSPAFRLFEAQLGLFREKEVTMLEAHPFAPGTSEARYVDVMTRQIRAALAGHNLRAVLYQLLARLPFPPPTDEHKPIYPDHPDYPIAQAHFASMIIDAVRQRDASLAASAETFFGAETELRSLRLGVMLLFTGVKLPLFESPRRWVNDILYLEDIWRRWMNEHIIAVRHSLGSVPGTGGTAGIEFLEQRLPQSIFSEIHQVKDYVVPIDMDDVLCKIYGFEAENAHVLQLKRRRK